MEDISDRYSEIITFFKNNIKKLEKDEEEYRKSKGEINLLDSESTRILKGYEEQKQAWINCTTLTREELGI